MTRATRRPEYPALVDCSGDPWDDAKLLRISWHFAVLYMMVTHACVQHDENIRTLRVETFETICRLDDVETYFADIVAGRV